MSGIKEKPTKENANYTGTETCCLFCKHKFFIPGLRWGRLGCSLFEWQLGSGGGLVDIEVDQYGICDCFKGK